MSDPYHLVEYGLLGAFDTIAAMRGEDIALASPVEHNQCNEEDDASERGSLDDREEGSVFSHSISSESSLSGISYSELQHSSLALACQLSKRFGVGREDRVLICCGNCTAAEIVGMLACMRIGAIFVMCDDSWLLGASHQRLWDIVQECSPQAAIVLGESDESSRFKSLAGLNVYRCALLSTDGSLVEWDGSVSEAGIEQVRGLEAIPWTNRTLYILYTSGSTGSPRGVLGSYRGLINRISWQYKQYPFSRGEVVCRRTPSVFVDSMAEIFSALLAGVPIWTPDFAIFKSLGILGISKEGNLLGASRITVLPSQLYAACISNPDVGEIWPKLAYIFVSGEECHRSVMTACSNAFPRSALINLYGSTEVSGDVSFAELLNPHLPSPVVDMKSLTNVVSLPALPIGLPISGNYLYVCIFSSEVGCFIEAPVGSVGELVVIGEHVANGYYGTGQSPNSTLKFMKKPWTKLSISLPPKAATYDCAFFTGDMVYKVSSGDGSGNFIYCGRKDRVVKIRGARVDLDEAERELFMALGIIGNGASLVSLSRTGQQSDDSGSNIDIVLFIEIESMRRLSLFTGNDVKKYLQARVAESFNPHYVIPWETLPRTTSNKIDRRKLGDELAKMNDGDLGLGSDVWLSSKDESDEQLKSTMRQILGIFCQVLPNIKFSILERIDIESWEHPHTLSNSTNSPHPTWGGMSFYEVGGDSMSAVPAMWHLRRLFKDVNNSLPASVLSMSMSKLVKLMISSSNEKVPTSTVNLASLPLVSAGAIMSKQPAGKVILETGTKRKFEMLDSSGLSSDDRHYSEKSLKEILIGTELSVSTIDFRTKRESNGEVLHRSTFSPHAVNCHISAIWCQLLHKCVDSTALIVSFRDNGISNHCDSLNPVLKSVAYVGSHFGDFCAFCCDTGAKLWEVCLGDHMEGGATCYCSRNLDGCRRPVVFVASYAAVEIDDASLPKRPFPRMSNTLGSIWCLDAQSGEVIWFADIAGEIKGTPWIDEQRQLIFIGSHDGFLYCFCALQGKLLNRLNCQGSIFAGPVSVGVDSLCIVTTNGIIQTVDINYKPPDSISVAKNDDSIMSHRWSFDCNSSIFSSPLIKLIDGAVTLVVCTTAGSIFHLRESSGAKEAQLIWKIFISSAPIFSSPTFVPPSSADANSSFIVGCHDGLLRNICFLTGNIIWEINLGSVIFSSPSVNILNFVDAASIAVCVVATAPGNIYVIDAVSGETLDTIHFQGEIYSSPVVYQNFIFLGCRDNSFYCLAICLSPKKTLSTGDDKVAEVL